MPKPDKNKVKKTKKVKNSLPGISDAQVKEMEKVLAGMKKNGTLPAGIPSNFADLINQSRDILKTVKKDSRNPLTGQKVSTKFFPFALPESKNVVILDYFDADPTVFHTAELKKMFESRGYTVTKNKLDLATLRDLPGQPIGVLYISTHARSAHETQPKKWPFSMATAESPSNTSLTKYDKQRIDPSRKDYIFENSNSAYTRDNTGKLITEDASTTYSVGIEFLKTYWRDGNGKAKKIFSKNSLVYLSACDAFDSEFIKLCSDCGAGTILTWDDDVSSEVASRTACYLLDRLLGTNQKLLEVDASFSSQADAFYREKLPQRPLQWGMVLQDMKNHVTRGGSVLGGPYKNGEGNMTKLTTVCANDCPGPFLAPSIISLYVSEEKRELNIQGYFGPNTIGKGKLSVLISENRNMSGAKELTVKEWKDEFFISCILGPDTAGYVMVRVDGRTSNAIPLTEWKGTITATATGKGSLKETCTIEFSLRTDGHLYRTAFTEPLNGRNSMTPPANEDPAQVLAAYKACYLSLLVPFQASQTSFISKLNYQAGGSVTYDPPKGDVISLSIAGSGAIPSFASQPTAASFSLGLGIPINVLPATSPALPFKLTYDIRLTGSFPADAVEHQVLYTYTKKSPGGTKKETKKVPLYLFGAVLTSNPLDLKKQASVDLPDPKINKPLSSGNDFLNETLNITAKTRFAPELAVGEDYFKIN